MLPNVRVRQSSGHRRDAPQSRLLTLGREVVLVFGVFVRFNCAIEASLLGHYWQPLIFADEVVE